MNQASLSNVAFADWLALNLRSLLRLGNQNFKGVACKLVSRELARTAIKVKDTLREDILGEREPSPIDHILVLHQLIAGVGLKEKLPATVEKAYARLTSGEPIEREMIDAYFDALAEQLINGAFLEMQTEPESS